MTQQTEAQRLADAIETGQNSCANVVKAADLLRRQDELLRQALEALTRIKAHGDQYSFEVATTAAAAIRKHLEAK